MLADGRGRQQAEIDGGGREGDRFLLNEGAALLGGAHLGVVEGESVDTGNTNVSAGGATTGPLPKQGSAR